jgi:glycosyltransferase involved in cell wall biosynthesis
MNTREIRPRDNDEAPSTPSGAVWPAIEGRAKVVTAIPKISIITPVKRGGTEWIMECWDSLIAQDETSWEWLLELDGVGELEKNVQSLLNIADSRLKVAGCGIQMFGAACRNMALSRAKGHWVLPLDADDKLPPPAALSTLLTAIEKTNAKACVGSIRVISSDGSSSEQSHNHEPGIRNAGETNQLALASQQMPHLSVGTLMETHLLTLLGGYPALPYAQDLIVQYLMPDFGGIIAVPEVTYIYRRHNAQMTANIREEQWRLAQWCSRVALSRMVVAAYDISAILPDYPVF